MTDIAVLITMLLASAMVALSLAVLLRVSLYPRFAALFNKPRGVWIAAGIRLIAAAALWFAAPATRFEGLFQVFAVVSLLSAIAAVALGHERIGQVVAWFIDKPPLVLRLWALIALMLGSFVIWALFV